MKISMELKEIAAIQERYKDASIYTAVDFERQLVECEVPDELIPVIVLGHLMRLRREEMEEQMLAEAHPPTDPKELN